MATFDSSPQKAGRGLNVDQTVALMNSLACHTEKALYSPGSPASSAFTTYIPTASKTATFASDEVVVIIGTLYYSLSNGVNTTGRLGIHVNGSLYESDFALTCPTSDSSGSADSRVIVKVGQFPGSTTIDLRFSKNTGSGTIYVGYAQLDILTFKYRPS